MQEIMERMLPVIYSNSLEYDPLESVLFDITETREIEGESTGNSKSNSQNQASGLNVNSDTPQGQLNKQEILNFRRICSMNKAELINAVAASADVSKKEAEAVVSATLDAITAALQEGEKVQLVGFGSFEVKKRAARIGRNPKTKETIEIPASVVPVFKAGKALKDSVSK